MLCQLTFTATHYRLFFFLLFSSHETLDTFKQQRVEYLLKFYNINSNCFCLVRCLYRFMVLLTHTFLFFLSSQRTHKVDETSKSKSQLPETTVNFWNLFKLPGKNFEITQKYKSNSQTMTVCLLLKIIKSNKLHQTPYLRYQSTNCYFSCKSCVFWSESERMGRKGSVTRSLVSLAPTSPRQVMYPDRRLSSGASSSYPLNGC